MIKKIIALRAKMRKRTKGYQKQVTKSYRKKY